MINFITTAENSVLPSVWLMKSDIIGVLPLSNEVEEVAWRIGAGLADT